MFILTLLSTPEARPMFADPALISILFLLGVVANAALYALAMPVRRPKQAMAPVVDLNEWRRHRR